MQRYDNQNLQKASTLVNIGNIVEVSDSNLTSTCTQTSNIKNWKRWDQYISNISDMTQIAKIYLSKKGIYVLF